MVKPAKGLKEMVEAFRRGGGAGKPMYLQAQASYARTDDEARQAAFDQWRQCGLESDVLTELATPADFDRAAHDLKPGDLKQHAAWVEEYFALSFEQVYIHQVGRDQERYIDAFGEHVLPAAVGRARRRAGPEAARRRG